MKHIRWNANPDIGFWINRPSIRFYYGIGSDALGHVTKEGIEGTWVPLNLEPYSIQRGDVILVLDIPAKWLMGHMNQRLPGNTAEQRRRLLNQEMYANWKKLDWEYYDGARIFVADAVPSRFVIGYMSR